MTGRIVNCEHETFDLPALLTWDVSYTGSVPCDSYAVTCAYTPELEPILRLAAGFTLAEGEDVLLRGTVDEYEIRQSAGGRTALVTGRGYAARLLDNESRAITYQGATLREIVRRHVTPYGIPCAQMADVRTVQPYTVASGVSQWKALEGFCRTYGGFTPRFDRYGRLLAAPETAGKTLKIDGGTALISLVKREDHYGVLSEVLVVDKTRNQTYSVKNEALIRRGGQCRRVLYTPGQSTWAAMRYTGEYQIDRSREDETTLEATLEGGFLAYPGDLVALELTRELGLSGTYRVAEVRNHADEAGRTMTLTLKERE